MKCKKNVCSGYISTSVIVGAGLFAYAFLCTSEVHSGPCLKIGIDRFLMGWEKDSILLIKNVPFFDIHVICMLLTKCFVFRLHCCGHIIFIIFMFEVSNLVCHCSFQLFIMYTDYC